MIKNYYTKFSIFIVIFFVNLIFTKSGETYYSQIKITDRDDMRSIYEDMYGKDKLKVDFKNIDYFEFILRNGKHLSWNDIIIINGQHKVLPNLILLDNDAIGDKLQYFDKIIDDSKNIRNIIKNNIENHLSVLIDAKDISDLELQLQYNKKNNQIFNSQLLDTLNVVNDNNKYVKINIEDTNTRIKEEGESIGSKRLKIVTKTSYPAEIYESFYSIGDIKSISSGGEFKIPDLVKIEDYEGNDTTHNFIPDSVSTKLKKNKTIKIPLKVKTISEGSIKIVDLEDDKNNREEYKILFHPDEKKRNIPNMVYKHNNIKKGVILDPDNKNNEKKEYPPSIFINPEEFKRNTVDIYAFSKDNSPLTYSEIEIPNKDKLTIYHKNIGTELNLQTIDEDGIGRIKKWLIPIAMGSMLLIVAL